MDVFVGQTRSRKLIAELTSRGWGECTNRGETPPRRHPWFLDNGAFSDWRSGKAFDAEAFLRDLTSEVVVNKPPVFVVCPDRVATGLESLEFSRVWRDRCELERPDLRYYLAVQDGMTEDDVDSQQRMANSYRGIFVGGSLQWKIRTGAAWVNYGKSRGLPVHIGRVGTSRRVAWAKRIGATSIDSCLPLWSKGNLDRFTRALHSNQVEFPW